MEEIIWIKTNTFLGFHRFGEHENPCGSTTGKATGDGSVS